jgi:hypothetical protein
MLEDLRIEDEVPLESLPAIFSAVDVRGLGVRWGRQERFQALLKLRPALRLVHFSSIADLGPGDTGAVARWPALQQIASLDLTSVSFRDRPWTVLLDRVPAKQLFRVAVGVLGEYPTKHALPSLREFRIYGSRRSGDLSGLVSWPGCKNLTTLVLRFTPWENEKSLQSPELANLRVLGVPYSYYAGIKGARLLAGARNLQRLHTLDVSECPLPDLGLRLLAKWPAMANLAVLGLNECTRFGPAGLQALAESPHLANLEALGLRKTRLGVGGAWALARAQTLGRLTALDLHGTQITDEGARALAVAHGLENLRYLDLSGNNLSPEARAAVRERWPLTRF